MVRTLLAANMVSAIALIGAIVLAVMGKDGWGWLMLISVLCSVGPKGKGE